MKKFSSISKRNNIEMLTMGKFDSLHLAHQAIFAKLDSRSIILFIKMPNIKDNIVPFYKRESYIQHRAYYIDFNIIKNVSGKQFIKYLTTKLPNLKSIIVGNDFRFGKNREYSSNDISKISCLNAVIVKEILQDGVPIHSSYIREFILNGDIKKANKMLGRFYSIEGIVIKGQGLGSRELYPTINLEVSDYILPLDGVYVTQTRINNITFDSISFIGNRLSTNMGFSIESHIIDEYIYFTPFKVEVFFIERLRDNKKFSSLETLKSQIGSDINVARKILEEIKKS